MGVVQNKIDIARLENFKLIKEISLDNLGGTYTGQLTIDLPVVDKLEEFKSNKLYFIQCNGTSEAINGTLSGVISIAVGVHQGILSKSLSFIDISNEKFIYIIYREDSNRTQVQLSANSLMSIVLELGGKINFKIYEIYEI